MKAIKLITKFKLSIIIPIYNSEKTLKNCLNSICKQRRKQSIEIILVNDCSNDKSKEICNSYIKKFNYIRLINNESNKGAGLTRNIGVKHSFGDYIFFVDSDDEIKKNKLSYLLKNLINDIDVLVHQHTDTRYKHKTEIMFRRPRNNKSHFFDCIKDYKKIRTYLFNYILKKNFLLSNKIYFKKIKVCEDIPFITNVYLKATTYNFLEQSIYLYKRYGVDNLSSQIGPSVTRSFLQVNNVLLEYLISLKKYNHNNNLKKFIIHNIKRNYESFSQLILSSNDKILIKLLNKFKNQKKLITKSKNQEIISFFKNKKKTKCSFKKIKKKKIKLIKIINSYKDQKYIIFGAGRMTKILLSIVKYKPQFIVDNNKKLLNKKLNGIKIKSLNFLVKTFKKQKKLVGFTIYNKGLHNLFLYVIKKNFGKKTTINLKNLKI